MSDEELFFGADDEPVKDEAEGSAVEDAAASGTVSSFLSISRYSSIRFINPPPPIPISAVLMHGADG